MATKPKFHLQILYSNKAPEVGRGLKSAKPYLVLEIPPKILVDWRGLKVKSPDVSYTKLIKESVELPFGLAKTPSLEKQINDAALNVVRDCHGKVVTKKYSFCRKYAKYLSVVARLSSQACQEKIMTVKKYAILKRDVLNFTQSCCKKKKAQENVKRTLEITRQK